MSRNKDDGQALVEFALVAPIMLLILLGGIELQLGILNTARLQNAAATIAAVPTVETDEIARVGFPNCSTIIVEDVVRTVTITCDNPFPVTRILVPTISAEATSAI